MSLTIEEKKIIFSNIEEISSLLNIQNEKSFLEQYFSVNEIDKCIKVGSANYEQVASLCMRFTKKNRKDFYLALTEHFLRQSQKFKLVYEKMIDASNPLSIKSDSVSRRNDESNVNKNDLFMLTSQMNELLKELKEFRLPTTSVHMQPSISNVDPGHRDVLNHGDVSKLQERLNEIEEERRHWLLESSCQTDISAKMEEMLQEINTVRQRCELIQTDALESDALLVEILTNYTATKNTEEETPLHIAARNGKTNFVEKLLQFSPGLVEIKNGKGLTPLEISVENKCTPVTEVLVNHNAAVDDKMKGLILLMAAEIGNDEIVEKLIAQSPEFVNIKDKDGFTPIHLAMKGLHWDLIETLLVNGAALDGNKQLIEHVFISAIKEEKALIVDKLLQLSPKLIECRNTDGSSIITLAVQKKYWSIVKILLKHNVKVDYQGCGTTLFRAAKNGEHETIQRLLQISPELVYARNEDGETGLLSAARHGHLNVVETPFQSSRDLACRPRRKKYKQMRQY